MDLDLRHRKKRREKCRARPAGSGLGALGHLGAACASHPWRVLAVWLVLLVGGLGARHVAGGTYDDDFTIPGSSAAQGLAVLQAHQSAAGGYSGTVVYHVGSGTLAADRGPIEQSVTDLRGLPHVLSVSDPLQPSTTSSDGETAYATVHFDQLPKSLGSGYVDQVDAAVSPARAAHVEVAYGGQLGEADRPAAQDVTSEGVGVIIALGVLVIGFGSLLAAGLPLLTALVSILIGVSALGLLAATMSFSTVAPTLATMIGLGVGIDYAVFLTTRYRQQLLDGFDPVTAAARTVATSGRAVLVAATTVSIAMLGLYASGITFIGNLGLGAVVAVAVSALGALTLVPAVLALAGRRIDRWHVRRPVAETAGARDGWRRWAEGLQRHPWRYLLAAVTLLGVLSVPLLSMRLGHVDDGADPKSYTDRQAYDLIAAGFGPGANGTFTVVVDTAGSGTTGSGTTGGSQTTAAALSGPLESALSRTPDVAHVSPVQTSPDGAVLTATVVPDSGPQDRATDTLLSTLEHHTVPSVINGTRATGYVTGPTASQLQFRDLVAARLWIIIALVVGTAFVLLLLTFRSVLVPLTAALLNLAYIGAAYGVVVAVFQWGWGRGLLGLGEDVPIESYVPMMMFAIVFGLSMDYEVFLLSRVKEIWNRTGDAAAAVAGGLSATARVISCAALIMASVFLAFAASSDPVVKMMAVGLAASVLVDATVVRLVLVPATMALLGRRNWWLPSWLDRCLPRIDAEGPALPATAAEPPRTSTPKTAAPETAAPETATPETATPETARAYLGVPVSGLASLPLPGRTPELDLGREPEERASTAGRPVR